MHCKNREIRRNVGWRFEEFEGSILFEGLKLFEGLMLFEGLENNKISISDTQFKYNNIQTLSNNLKPNQSTSKNLSA